MTAISYLPNAVFQRPSGTSDPRKLGSKDQLNKNNMPPDIFGALSFAPRGSYGYGAPTIKYAPLAQMPWYNPPVELSKSKVTEPVEPVPVGPDEHADIGRMINSSKPGDIASYREDGTMAYGFLSKAHVNTGGPAWKTAENNGWKDYQRPDPNWDSMPLGYRLSGQQLMTRMGADELPPDGSPVSFENNEGYLEHYSRGTDGRWTCMGIEDPTISDHYGIMGGENTGSDDAT